VPQLRDRLVAAGMGDEELDQVAELVRNLDLIVAALPSAGRPVTW
jgi:hypothetical protein